ncbi:S8 family serine peptidase [Flavobacterium sp.]|uniref:S8 family serine peptidase n=1 Tax=Flavobacterium sp. TaxID=239 RepID=UPI002B4AE508|nr:S8 family serine peptidase [Flavobacterium sp.]HLP65412.1 S8 family serine peptidase [Flavobacterium sp.]
MQKIYFFLLLTISFSSFSQDEEAWVYFTDKPNAQYYLDNPLEMLTQRALDRRANQGIALQINDTPIHQPYIDQVMASEGVTVKAKSKWLNCVHVRGNVNDINALSVLSFVDTIVFADDALNTSGKIRSPKPINPVNKTLDVSENFNYGNSQNQIEMLNGHLLHQANYTGNGKIIAVLDSGFINVNSTAPFQRLFDNNLILGGYNYVSQNEDVYSLHNHGTMTLSCMGGYVDGELVGTAPNAQYYLFVTEDVVDENPVEESYWVEAAEEADRLGADIISTSLGYYVYDNPNYSHVYTNMTGNEAFASKGANIAFSKGIIVVASAGNSGASAEPLNHISVPAEATNVLAVGAVRFDETYATFSSVGPGYENRIKPEVMAKGQAATVANTAGNIQTASGTSFSCPIMAGMVASFWSAVPSLTNQQVINFIIQSADRFNNPTDQFGYGIPDFQSALQSALLSVDEAEIENYQVFPNPTTSTITMVSPANFVGNSIKMYNGLGQLVLTNTIENPVQTLSLDGLNSGVYFYTISTSDIVYQGKIIKN